MLIIIITIITATTYCCIFILIFVVTFLVFVLFLSLQCHMTIASISQSGGGSHWQISELGVWDLVQILTLVFWMLSLDILFNIIFSVISVYTFWHNCVGWASNNISLTEGQICIKWGMCYVKDSIFMDVLCE